MTFLRIVIPLYLFDLSMIFSENRYPLFGIMLYLAKLQIKLKTLAAIGSTTTISRKDVTKPT